MIEKGYTLTVLDKGYVRYIDHMGSDKRIVEAARISYKSPSKGDEADKKLLEYLWKNKHTSPFEMCKLTLNIKLPIFVMRQYVRHRMQNLNEVSSRYTELQNEFYIPESWRKQDKTNKQSSYKGDFSESEKIAFTYWLKTHSEDSYKLYEKMLATGIAKEMARFVLPVNIYTEIYTCWDLKNLLHFITLREDNHAQWEIQEYGRAIKKICLNLFPWTMEAFEKYKFIVNEK